MFQIIADRLHVDGRPAAFVPSPNTSGARIEPVLIVLHDTAGSTAEGAVSWFSNPASKVSAHVVIETDGRITQCVEFDRVAWHAGASSWKGRQGCNGFAIGIEIVNPGGLKGAPDKAVAEFGKCYSGTVAASDAKHWSKLWLPYTQVQLAAVEALIRALVAAYPTIVDLAGHHDISPGRKEDPTPLMDWERMRAALGPRPPPHEAHDVKDAQQVLAELGYNPGKVDGLMGQKTRAALFAFQQQNRLPATGALDQATDHRLFDHPDPPKEMPTGTRAETTAADLRAQGSGTAWATTTLKITGLLGLGLQVANSLLDATQTVNDVAGAVSTIETGVRTVERVDALLPQLWRIAVWAQTPRGLAALGLLALIVATYALAKFIETRRVEDARTGANAK